MGEKIKIYISANQNDLSTEKNETCFRNFMKLLEIFFNRFFNKEIDYCLSYAESKTVTSKNADILFILLTEKLINEDQTKKQLADLVKEAKPGNLFKILLQDLPKTNQPVQLQAFINYYFYYYDNDENRILDFFELQAKNNTLFNNKIINLGYDVMHYLNTSKENANTGTDPKKNVFVAFAGIDQANNREIIKRELQNKGFNVLPENLSFTDPEKLKSDLLTQLAKTSLSIHFLGEDNYKIPNVTDNFVELQNQLAIEHYNNLTSFSLGQKDLLFSRIIWLPNDLHIINESQQIWLENFIQSADSQIGGELIETPIETLKTIIDEKLVKKDHYATQMLKGSVASANKVYVLYEYKNKNEADKINEILNSNNQKPIFTLYDKNYLSVIDNHRQNLIEADSILILYLNNNPDWLFSKIMDIRKSPGFGRRKSFKNKIIIHHEKIEDIDVKEMNFTLIDANKDMESALAKIFGKQEKK